MNVKRLWVIAAFFLLPPLWAGEDQPDESKKKKWDVADFSEKTYEIEINTDEGTWMNLDLSPDGSQLVFDLLGDIYLLSVTGGEAKLIAGGLAWEMQPRFSPDGKRIAFTSDREGADNIWTMARDGSDKEQVTEETFRLLNSPAWSPDSNYIVARKHFTSSRSIGSGEIWLYHRSGGKGIQLNKKPNDQKDLGEPSFSPDGRYVYFSQDTTSGSVFQYSKDPSPGIYSIKRIDLEKGGIETVIRGSGGAIRPTPSPDGKLLAYVRRHQYDTKLWIHNLESGENTIVFDKLDRDMQETWAIHGVYPTFAWTPDQKSLIFWAGGKIHKLDLTSKTDRIIPFHVKTKHTMVDVLRHHVEVAPDTYETQMLRWVRVSPSGDQVVYQALGYLYIRDLPKGKPHRLTKQTDHFEQDPSWSRDGKSIVYTTWNDEEFGSIRIATVKDGKSHALISKPGHYREPCLSPSGKTLVYRKTGGGYLRSPLWSVESGLYMLNLDGKHEAKRVTKKGSRPHFANKEDRFYYTTRDKKSVLTLRSIDLSGNKGRKHVESDMGHEFLVSPDGNWLSYVDDWRVFAAPFTHTSKVFKIGPKSTNIPIRQLSSESGWTLGFSSDSSRVYWSMGNRLFHRDLKDAFSFVEGAPEELPEPTADGQKIGFTFNTDKPNGLLALVGGRLITMKGDQVIEKGTILIKNNRIEAIGEHIKIPKGTKIIDVTGKTIIPGLIDVHAHGGRGSEQIVPQQNWIALAGLTFGVTTIHDPSNDTATIFAAAEMARAGQIVSPRIFSTGTIVYGAKAPGYTARIDSLEDAALHLKRLKSAGAFSIKSYNQPRRDQRQQVIQAARAENMMVVPEGGSLLQHNLSMIADGHTGIEHAIPVAAVYQDIVQFWAQSGTYYTPTLGVAYGGISGEHYWYEHTDVWSHPRLSQFVPPSFLESRARRRTKAPEKEYNHIAVAAACKKLSDAGVKINLGAHGQREGLAAHWELWMLGQGGMSPMECLASGTINGAHYLGLERDLGSLEVGKLADLAVLEKNPLETIRNTDSVSLVMVNGRLFDAKTMDEIGNHTKKCKPFFWEFPGASSPSTTTISRSVCGACDRH